VTAPGPAAGRDASHPLVLGARRPSTCEAHASAPGRRRADPRRIPSSSVAGAPQPRAAFRRAGSLRPRAARVSTRGRPGAVVRLVLAGLIGAGLAAGPGEAAEPKRVKVGVLKLTSSAPVFLGVEKGFFREAGVEPELVYFQAAQPVAVAIAAGEVEVGATGLTAGLYNIVAGGEKLWVVADKGREWAGHPLTALVVQKDGPVRAVKDLRGRKVAITQLGSTFHYMLGNLVEGEGMTLADVEPAPLRTLGAMAEALQGRRVDAALLPQPFAGSVVEKGGGRILFWVGDRLPYQVAAIFYSGRFARDRDRAVAFMKGYVRASRYYHDAVLAERAGPRYDEVVAITARYTEASPELIRAGFPYQDRDGRLDLADVGRQLAWYHKAGMITRPLVPRDLVDASFLEDALRSLGR
jgi:NitT/TauT family transport system substrate-binding protein